MLDMVYRKENDMDRLTEIKHNYQDYEFMDDGMATYMNKLAKYENCLLEPEEVKELVLDICKGNYQKWYEKLSNLLREKYDNAK
jgi:hypothetical protein